MSPARPAVEVVPGRGLRVGDVIRPLVSGAVHYWRHDPADWPALLDAVVALRVPAVETYVPWSVHEQADRSVDFTGARDVERFLRLAEDRGLLAVVRPGPHINAELPDFGFPQRVLWDPACQARGPLGTPVVQHSRSSYFPCPSYGSSTFLAEVDRWYDAAVPRLAALQWPDGPVVAMQTDNEMACFFFVDPFVMDYHPELVADWRAWSGFDGEPPTDGRDDADRVASWVRHKEVSRHQALARLSEGLRSRGVVVPLLHNDFPHLGSPVDQATLEATGIVDIAANDLYVMREDVADAMAVARTLAGSSQLPCIAELGAGWVADVVGIPQRIAPLDEELVLLAVLCTGVRAWNWYMLAEREHWYGSPIDRRGRLREDEAALYPRILAVLDDLDWWSLERDAPVLLLRDRDEDRRHRSRRTACEVNAVLDPLQLPAALRVLEPDRQEPCLVRWRGALEHAGLDFDEGSSDAPPERSRYAAVVDWRDDPDDVLLPTARYRLDAPPGVSLHRFAGPGREVLGLVNRTAEPAGARIAGLGPCRLEGRWHRGDLDVVDVADVGLPPWSAQLWEVTR